jgi:hypothetical protein
MGCICSIAPNEEQIQFDLPDTKINKKNPSIKESNNESISIFKEKLKDYGDYLTKEEFESNIPKEIQKYMTENPFEKNRIDLKENSIYEIEPIQFKNSNIYKGQWNKDFKMHGLGNYYLMNDKVFAEGIWENGELIYGRVFLPNGDIYEGEIKNSEFNGKGKLISNNGDIYDGDFENGEKTGFAKLIFSDGTIYEGNLEKGEFKGKGHMIWKDGYDYNGEFKGAILNGKGKLCFKDGDIYEGDFENNLFHGKGKYTYAKSGNTYEGEFQYGVKKGKGIFTTQEYKYDGNWDNDLPCGFGNVTNLKNNGIVKCIWRYGKMAEEPTYENANKDDFNSIDLNIIKPEEMNLNTKTLSHLDIVENDSTQYKIGDSISFL